MDRKKVVCRQHKYVFFFFCLAADFANKDEY